MKRIVLATVLAIALASVAPSSAIVNGSPADPGEYPFMAALYTGSSPRTGQYCGGSLVAPDVVVTAAHCVFDLLDNLAAGLPVDLLGLKVRVQIGSSELGGDDGERILARRITPHPDPEIDIAVIELAQPSSFTPLAWASPADAAKYPEGTPATIIGWGNTSEGGGSTDDLLEATVPIVSDAACAAKYDGSTVPDKEVCAGYEDGGTDSCQGDSGGPMMIEDGGSWLLIGVTSWGDGCARPGKPGVYAEVSAASLFIADFA